jgi:hypothetical protein
MTKTPRKTQNINDLGTIKSVVDHKKHEYRMATTVKYKGELYRKGDAVELQGKLLKIFLDNNYIIG